jgi:hypothetical protein
MNNWNIKISEVFSPSRGFVVTIENNGEFIAKGRGISSNFDRAISEGRNIVQNWMKFNDARKKRAVVVNDDFIKRFIKSGKFVGIYNSVVKQDAKGVPFLEVTMNTDNQNLVSLVPNVVTDRKTMNDYKVVKVSASSNPNPIV